MRKVVTEVRILMAVGKIYWIVDEEKTLTTEENMERESSGWKSGEKRNLGKRVDGNVSDKRTVEPKIFFSIRWWSSFGHVVRTSLPVKDLSFGMKPKIRFAAYIERKRSPVSTILVCSWCRFLQGSEFGSAVLRGNGGVWVLHRQFYVEDKNSRFELSK